MSFYTNLNVITGIAFYCEIISTFFLVFVSATKKIVTRLHICAASHISQSFSQRGFAFSIQHIKIMCWCFRKVYMEKQSEKFCRFHSNNKYNNYSFYCDRMSTRFQCHFSRRDWCFKITGSRLTEGRRVHQSCGTGIKIFPAARKTGSLLGKLKHFISSDPIIFLKIHV